MSHPSDPTPPRPRAAARPSLSDVRRWRRHLADEYAEAAVYRDLAHRRSGEEREILLALADAEGRHAAHWQELLGDQVGRLPRGDLRNATLRLLARRFGSVFVLALAQRAESRSTYETDIDATPTMAADERIHEEVIRALAARGRSRLAGTFRAAVFGANDGLVSNLALVLGVGAAGAATGTVLVTGLAGLLAGALSMGAGEYVSVRSQRELLAATTPDAGAHAVVPHLDVDANELTLVYRARGMSPSEAQHHADEVLSLHSTIGSPTVGSPVAGSPAVSGPVGLVPGPLTSPVTAAPVATVVDEHEMVGTGWAAAASSFCFFASGAVIPVLPFLLGLSGGPALLVATGVVGLALLLTGALVGLLSGGPPVRRAVRQLIIGLAAAGVTYGLGLLFGAATG